MTKKKKQTVVLGILIFLMILLGVGYGAIKKINAVKEAEKEQSIELYHLDTEKAKKIIITNENGTIELTKKASNWIFAGDSSLPIDADKVDNILSLVKVINANSEVTDGTEELSQYGLEKPEQSIYIELTNGVKAKVSFGTEVPILGGYYCLVDDGTKVYTMGEELYQAILRNKMDFVKMEKIPSIESKNVKKLELTNRKGKAVTIQKISDGSFVIKGAYDKTVTGNSEAILGLFENYGELAFDNCVEYSCKDFSQYGLENPEQSLKITYTVKKDKKNVKEQYILYVGNKSEDGSYYVTPEGSAYVYQMEEDILDELLNVKIFDYIDKTVFAFSTDSLKAITVEDKKGNKKNLTVKKDLDTLTALQALTFSGEIEEKVSENEPIYTCIVQNNGEKSIVSFLPYDGKKYYRVDKDGEQLFLVDKKAVDKLLK
ncbi:DUF4340 domain-containing protein [Velocimicrobium porci]|uniref:DUF4340 domain-containing protein n=1 Tax=Velocimicrobium porci TaxID=2606634 RepID=A0A6L5XVG4_9FIRM|nr:DUF4340 domain-containing protein [Velocimicrobium porci]MSS62604.1 DUF4340 domain-containing protein [Velocimicrobium porci]